MKTIQKEDLPYAVVQRLRLVDTLLVNGHPVNRQILMDYFGISMVQASKDLSLYQQLAPANMAYDLSAKTYQAQLTFRRVWK